MAGVIGATTGKFVLVAATLLLQGRVDNARVGIAIAPGTAASKISPRLAGGIGHGRKVKIGIRGEYAYATIDGVAPSATPGAEMTIGRDILDTNPIEIDFPHHRVRLLLAGEARKIERGMTAIPVAHRPDGALTAPIAVADGQRLDATIDLASETGVTAPASAGKHDVQVGPATLHDVDLATGDTPSIGLLAFRHVRVVFDLGHDRIWVAG